MILTTTSLRLLTCNANCGYMTKVKNLLIHWCIASWFVYGRTRSLILVNSSVHNIGEGSYFRTFSLHHKWTTRLAVRCYVCIKRTRWLYPMISYCLLRFGIGFESEKKNSFNLIAGADLYTCKKMKWMLNALRIPFWTAPYYRGVSSTKALVTRSKKKLYFKLHKQIYI